MSKPIDNLELILSDFELWYKDDHGHNEKTYDNIITLKNLSTLSKRNFINFFVEFRRVGGCVQTSGQRNLNTFKENISNNFESFRKYILLPFNEKFDIKKWLLNRKNFPQWGIGISTIYLNRINLSKYAILNNKTIEALNKLGLSITTSIHSYQTYEYVTAIENKIINTFKQITNFYKVDALCHYIHSVLPKEKFKILLLDSDKNLKSKFITSLNNDILVNTINSDNTLSKNENIINVIKKLNATKNKYIEYKGRKYNRRQYQLELIKKLRGYKCQFCNKQIIKADNTYYIEACHIKPKCKGGSDYLNNILILCPNCHKEFDLGNREELSYTNNIYKVKVNGVKYEILFEG